MSNDCGRRSCRPGPHTWGHGDEHSPRPEAGVYRRARHLLPRQGREAWRLAHPSGHTNRLRIHAAWAGTEDELEEFHCIAAEIRADFPDALVEVRKLQPERRPHVRHTTTARTSTGEPGDALHESHQANAREIGVLAFGSVCYPKRLAEQTYDQDPEARKVFLE